jgi:hypothetical protein
MKGRPVFSIGLAPVLGLVFSFLATGGQAAEPAGAAANSTPAKLPATITLNSGKTYESARLVSADPSGLTIEYAPPGGGIGLAKIRFSSLPDSLARDFGYDPAKAAAFDAEQGQAMAQWRAQMQADEARAKAEQANQQIADAQERAADAESRADAAMGALADLRQQSGMGQAQAYAWASSGGAGYGNQGFGNFGGGNFGRNFFGRGKFNGWRGYPWILAREQNPGILWSALQPSLRGGSTGRTRGPGVLP